MSERHANDWRLFEIMLFLPALIQGSWSEFNPGDHFIRRLPGPFCYNVDVYFAILVNRDEHCITLFQYSADETEPGVSTGTGSGGLNCVAMMKKDRIKEGYVHKRSHVRICAFLGHFYMRHILLQFIVLDE